MEGFGESLAYEVAPFGIQVTLVEPGNVRTDFTGSRRDVTGPEGDDPYRQAVDKAVGHMAEDEANGVPPDDVAAVVAAGPRGQAAAPARLGGQARRADRDHGQRLLPYRLFERAAKGSLGV